MGTGTAPDIRRRPHRATKHPAAGDLVRAKLEIKGFEKQGGKIQASLEFCRQNKVRYDDNDHPAR
jgi:hypothetical protein